MSDVIKIVSAVTTSLLASLRYIIAVLLVVLLFWILIETAYCVGNSSNYSKLLWLFIIALALLVVVVVWKFVDLMKALTKPERLTGYAGNLKLIPLAILDLALIYAAIFVSGQMDSPLTTPLLSFCQTIFTKLTS